jgi:hypothetical protein
VREGLDDGEASDFVRPSSSPPATRLEGVRSVTVETSKPISLSYRDLLVAFECVSACTPGESEVYICRKTGRIYLVSALVDSDEDIPDDIETSDRYRRLPRRWELGLGRELVFDFVRSDMPDEWERLVELFRRRGAYAEFRQILRAHGKLDQWYAFESGAVEKALRDWSRENDIQFSVGETFAISSGPLAARNL